jgi:hypothetical protein
MSYLLLPVILDFSKTIVTTKSFLLNLQRIKRHLDLKQSTDTYLQDSYEETTTGYPLEKI